MKNVFLTFILLFLFAVVRSQGVAVNNTGAAPDPSSILDVSDTNKGMLIPRLETVRRVGIANPAEGLIVYDNNIKTFWYYSLGNWKEIPNTAMGATPMGPATGDLSGNYPSPTVSKIQNLDVQFGVPFDKQVMKWDMLNNRWQGLNDSLFLPYNVTYGSPTRLFGITNANTTGGSSAIYARSGITGAPFTPGPSVGIWGDNSAGMGIFGSSNSGIGTYGASFQNYGIYGTSFSANHAGVYGSGGAGINSAGIFGEAGSGGIGVRGVSSFGKAAVFENTSTSNTDTLLKLVHAGTGRGITLSMSNTSNNTEVITVNNAGIGQLFNLYNSNTSNNAHMFFANQTGTGVGFYMSIANTLNTHPGILVEHAGTGSGIESYGYKGKAGFFQIPAATNASAALSVSTLGTGNAGTFAISNTANNSTGVTFSTNGTGSVGSFTLTNATNSNPAVTVSTTGTGRGIQSVVNNAASNAAALYANSSGANGLQAYAQGTGVLGQATGLTNGIGVYGIASLNSNNGIGVKGESYSNVTTSGSVTGINNSDGIGVYGYAASVSGNGMAVYGLSNTTSFTKATIMGENNAGGYAIAGNSTGPNATGIHGLAIPSGVSFGIGVVGQSYNYGDGVRGFGGGAGNGVSGFAQDGGTGAGIYGAPSIGSNSGRAALFEVVTSTNTYEAVRMNNAGLAATLSLNATNAANTVTMVRIKKSGTGDYIIFEDGTGINKMRLDNTGKGFFNGGTQTGGADIAEAFDVTGDRAGYEPGDVLVISTTKDRTVEKSTQPYSILVAGVYATKPGVLMTEENIDADLTDKVPMGVVGVIPVKVCSCDGDIKRGDILVTSSIPGVAMKGNIRKVKPGQILGKALENYSSPGIGKIKVLVNAR